MRKRLGWIRPTLVAGSLAIAAVTGGQLIPLGDDFQINTYTTGGQQSPQVIAIDGGFVVVWASSGSPGDDDVDRSIQAQRFDTDGQAVGPQFQVNQLTGDDELRPRIHRLDGGGFVAQWSSNLEGTFTDVHYARTFDSEGIPMTDDFATATGSDDIFLRGHSISQTTEGDLISAYGLQTGNLVGHMEVGLFDLAGNPITSHFVYDADFTIPMFPTIDRSPDGSFAVAWIDESLYQGITGHRLDATGAPVGGTFRATGGGPFYSFINAPIEVDFRDDGKFVVAWAGTTFDLYYYFRDGVTALSFNPDGTISGLGADVAIPETSTQSEPAVDPMNDDNFLVVWGGTDGTANDDVFARVVDGTGQLIGEHQRINSSTGGDQFQPDVAGSPDGQHFLVVWNDRPSNGGTAQQEIRGRFFRSETVFGDGFESGDTSRWSSTGPPSSTTGDSGGG